MKEAWKTYLSDSRRRKEFYITLPILVLLLISLTTFLNYNERRNGYLIKDPLLQSIPAVNLTWLIFLLLYMGLAISVISMVKNPSLLIFTIQAYAVLILFRIIAMYMVPFLPPTDSINLRDPVVEYFGTGKTLTKDLFFSGHTATLFILFLTAEKKILKYLLLCATILVGISVLLQHVHYTIDVFAAPLFAYMAFRGTVQLKKRFNILKI